MKKIIKKIIFLSLLVLAAQTTCKTLTVDWGDICYPKALAAGFPVINYQHKATPEHAAFLAHIKLIQELKQRFNKRDNHTNRPSRSAKLSQTEAYLERYATEIQNAFNYYDWETRLHEDKIKTHSDLIESIITKEKELADTHFCFYHAHNKDYIILQDFIKLLTSYMQLIGPRQDFSCMRLKDIHTIPFKNVNEYLDKHTEIYDHDELTRSRMISVNLSLFGNHYNFGECTFGYFLTNTSVCWISLYNRLEPIFEHYQLDKKYISELTDLTSYLTSATGNILQICIPHDKVDELVYLSKACGPPYNNVILNEHYDHSKKRHTSIKPLIEHMCKNPHAIDDLNFWQARLMFFDPMLDMDPTIKVFTYNTINPENMVMYRQKLHEIVIKIVLDYVKATGTNNKKPLAKLHDFMLLHSKITEPTKPWVKG